MNNDLFKAYQEARKKYGLRAHEALRSLRPRDKLFPSMQFGPSRRYDTWQEACFTHNGFDIVVRAIWSREQAEEHVLCGRFSTKWEKGAIRNPQSLKDDNVCDWFIPETTFAEHYDWIKSSKEYTRHGAWLKARGFGKDILERALALGHTWQLIEIDCKVSRCNVVLAEYSTGADHGDEMTPDELRFIAEDIVYEQIREAQEKLKELCKECENEATAA